MGELYNVVPSLRRRRIHSGSACFLIRPWSFLVWTSSTASQLHPKSGNSLHPISPKSQHTNQDEDEDEDGNGTLNVVTVRKRRVRFGRKNVKEREYGDFALPIRGTVQLEAIHLISTVSLRLSLMDLAIVADPILGYPANGC
jgi:hypothetical protein